MKKLYFFIVALFMTVGFASAQTTYEGTVYYNADWAESWDDMTYDSTASATLVANADGSYTLKDAFVGIPEINFTVADNVITITNAGYETGYYKYFYTYYDNDAAEWKYGVLCDAEYSSFEITDEEISLYFYNYDFNGSADVAYVGGTTVFRWVKPDSTSAVEAIEAVVDDADTVQVYSTSGVLEYSGSREGMGSLGKGIHIVKSGKSVKKVVR